MPYPFHSPGLIVQIMSGKQGTLRSSALIMCGIKNIMCLTLFLFFSFLKTMICQLTFLIALKSILYFQEGTPQISSTVHKIQTVCHKVQGKHRHIF